jgi:hypothetical protein
MMRVVEINPTVPWAYKECTVTIVSVIASVWGKLLWRNHIGSIRSTWAACIGPWPNLEQSLFFIEKMFITHSFLIFLFLELFLYKYSLFLLVINLLHKFVEKKQARIS